MSSATICGCVTPRLRPRVAAALRGFASIHWTSSFAELEQWISVETPGVVILSAHDDSGAPAGSTASAIASLRHGIPVVLYATRQEITAGALNSAAITDLLVAEDADSRAAIQSAVLDAVQRAAADRVAAAIRKRMSGSVAAFAELAVRHPSCARVEQLSDRLGIHRQTAATWCRKERIFRPEELLMWCRVLLASALLEATDRPVASLAIDLDFPSTVSLRNLLKRYTGMTAMEIRSAGLGSVLSVFDARLDRTRSAPAASAVEAVPLSMMTGAAG